MARHRLTLGVGYDSRTLETVPTSPERDGSKSICTKPSYGPIHYHWYRKDQHRSLIATVRQIAVDEGLSERDVARVVGEFRALLLSLIGGKLKPIEHVKGPMASVTDLVIFEVFTNTEVHGGVRFAVRAYHVEPRPLRRPGGSTVVGLHVHAKDLSDEATINTLQNVELQIARKRYYHGKSSNWGDAALLPLEDIIR